MHTEINPHMSADELRDSWQGRVIYATRYEPLGMTVLSVIAQSYDDAMPFLMHALFPGFESITTPFICSAGKINKNGNVVADVIWRDWEDPSKNEVIANSTQSLRDVFRKLADGLDLWGKDRIELFLAVRKWVVADQRLDPDMDPMDPDAKRLTQH
jgi:hypothetical protein